jgi:hypothetical protein
LLAGFGFWATSHFSNQTEGRTGQAYCPELEWDRPITVRLDLYPGLHGATSLIMEIQTFMKIFFHPLFLRKKQVPVFDASILFFIEDMAGRGF